MVIANVLLPDGTGHEIASRAADLGIKTVLMTGHPDEAQALLVSNVTHLLKPFSIDDFETMIRRYLGA